MKKLYFYITSCLILLNLACNNYLDVVPDNIATIDYAFRNKVVAEKFLFTCYSYLPEFGSVPTDPTIFGSDEVWVHSQDYYGARVGNFYSYNIKLGWQNTNDPHSNFWDGRNYGHNLFIGIRDCNVFLENIDNVFDLSDNEKKRWTAEVKFLKAYYHYYLLRMYGPIPIIRENLPISASTEDVRVFREPVDECVKYIVQLLDEAKIDLPLEVGDRASEMGRITQPITLAIKAEVLVTAASPLFNGNIAYTHVTDSRGNDLFNAEYDLEKWRVAMDACKNAIDTALLANHDLYVFDDARYSVSEETRFLMSARNVGERWNREIIWGMANGAPMYGNDRTMEYHSFPALTETDLINVGGEPIASAPIHIAEMFHSSNGVPINEDNDYDFEDRYSTTYAHGQSYYVSENIETAKLNLNREPRFYASLGFDGGIWFGNGKWKDIGMGEPDETSWVVRAKAGQTSGKMSSIRYNFTGYIPKKCVSFETVRSSTGSMTRKRMTFPIMRLADLYLLYAEARNEYLGPDEEVCYYIDLVRERSGLEGVVESWREHSIFPEKPSTKNGLREIIQKERMIELVFEGKRFWDIRRWKIAEEILNNKTITGWNVNGSSTLEYYTVVPIETIYFTTKDYLWPLREQTLRVNPNLVQNPYW